MYHVLSLRVVWHVRFSVANTSACKWQSALHSSGHASAGLTGLMSCMTHVHIVGLLYVLLFAWYRTIGNNTPVSQQHKIFRFVSFFLDNLNDSSVTVTFLNPNHILYVFVQVFFQKPNATTKSVRSSSFYNDLTSGRSTVPFLAAIQNYTAQWQSLTRRAGICLLDGKEVFGRLLLWNW